MAFKLGPLNLNAVAQGVGGFVFGSGESSEDDDRIEQLLERISNGVLADDRRAAEAELRDAVTDNSTAQAALGTMGIPVLMSVLREDREDTHLVRGALEVLVAGLTVPAAPVAEPTSPNGLSEHKSQQEGAGRGRGGGGAGRAEGGVKQWERRRGKVEWPIEVHRVPPGAINSELFAREPNSVALLLSLLEEEDFYIRYHTLQLLTILLSICPHRLQDAILVIPQGVGRLMDMMQLNEREVIRNEALVLMINLTRSAEEIQKIVVFDGAFERAFKMIHDEGGSNGGVVVQDCVELVSNLLRCNPTNQRSLRETLGLGCIPPLLAVHSNTPTSSSSATGGTPGGKAAKHSSNGGSSTARGGGGGGVGGVGLLEAGASGGKGLQSLGLQPAQDSIPRQKATNLLCTVEMVLLLLSRNPNLALADDTNLFANQNQLAQAKLMDYLLGLAVAPGVPVVAIRAQALRALGCLVVGNAANKDELAGKRVGLTGVVIDNSSKGTGDDAEQSSVGMGEPALHAVLRTALRASSTDESLAADYVLCCFCEANPEGQTMLASTFTPLPHTVIVPSTPTPSLVHRWTTAGSSLGLGRQEHQETSTSDRDASLSFGGMLVQALIGSSGEEGLEASCRAASVLSHILKDNRVCKERVLGIPLEIPSSVLTPPDLLMPRIMRYLAAAAPPLPRPHSPYPGKGGGRQGLVPPSPTTLPAASPSLSPSWLQPVLLRLLLVWLADCPPAVTAFLAHPGHLPYLVDLCSLSPSPAPAHSAPGVHVAGLAALVLGACVVFNDGSGALDAPTVLDIITQRIGLSALFARLQDLMHDPLFLAACAATRPPNPLDRVSAAQVVSAVEGLADGGVASPSPAHSLASSSPPGTPSAVSTGFPFASFYDPQFVAFVCGFEKQTRSRILELFAQPRSGVGVLQPGTASSGKGAQAGAAGRGGSGEKQGRGGGGIGGEGGEEQREGEDEHAYLSRLHSIIQAQRRDLKILQQRNAALAAEAMSWSTGSGAEQARGMQEEDARKSQRREEGEEEEGRQRAVGREGEVEQLRAEVEAARAAVEAAKGQAESAEAAALRAVEEAQGAGAELERARREVEELREEREALGSEVKHWRFCAAEKETELQALSVAYASLEQEKNSLEDRLAAAELSSRQGQSSGASGVAFESELEAARKGAREQAQAESEGELNDLLVCLGQEEKKVEVLRARLEKLGEDAEALLSNAGVEAEDPDAGFGDAPDGGTADADDGEDVDFDDLVE